jgi:hypothetical protein
MPQWWWMSQWLMTTMDVPLRAQPEHSHTWCPRLDQWRSSVWRWFEQWGQNKDSWWFGIIFSSTQINLTQSYFYRSRWTLLVASISVDLQWSSSKLGNSPAGILVLSSRSMHMQEKQTDNFCNFPLPHKNSAKIQEFSLHYHFPFSSIDTKVTHTDLHCSSTALYSNDVSHTSLSSSNRVPRTRAFTPQLYTDNTLSGFWRSEVHFLRLRIRFVRQDLAKSNYQSHQQDLLSSLIGW